MIMPIVIIILVIIGLIYFKLEHKGKIIKTVILIALALLIYFSLTKVVSLQEIDLTSPRQVANVLYTYVGWIGNTLTQLWDIGKETATIVGHTIKLNETEITKNLSNN
ncbi:MAG: hypothetical protein PHX15_01530 [Candidatus Nanoarchaeia archaeon]|jgi:small-conductance mechanosensitive channel|nr:hypothetical protein [Candidatus Nanoarchaeia archaeon]MDD3993856.1 hypothetical protein [Candidatus Nanoarchaeia archaeon]